jgi:scyllo-inositol 2-dehydrogenase (NADP+)
LIEQKIKVVDKIKWGILGCGNIANKFASDLSLIEDAQIYAVASRNKERANNFKNKHDALVAYNSYDQLFKDDDIDIVYIATPHISHAELSIKAMENKKHVLCEKPLAINKKEAKAMIETSCRTNRFFMEALWTRFNPSFKAIKKCIEKGEIGEIKYINSDFSFKSDKSLDSRVLNLNLGGGAILDIGIYPAFLAYTLLGIPKDFIASSIFHEVTKCDTQTSMIFNYDSAQAVLYCSFESNSDKVACISGTKGEIYLHDSWHVAPGYTLVKNKKEQKIDLPVTGFGFTYEILECHNCLRNKKIESDLWSHQNSMDLITILDQIRDHVGLKYPDEII